MSQQTSHNSPPKVRPTQDRGPHRQVHVGGVERWQKVARRIRVPLGFFTAAVYLVEVVRRAPHSTAIAWSLALVLPGLGLRALASGTVKKNQRAQRHRTVCLHAQSALSWIHADRRRVRSGVAQLAAGAAARGRIRRNLHSGHCVGGAISSRNIPRVRRLLPQRAPIHPAPHTRQAPGRNEQTRRFPTSYQSGYGRLFVRPLPQAPRVQFCSRGRTAVPEPALPATGAGNPYAPGLVSAFCYVKSKEKRPGQSMRSRAEH